MPKQKKLDKKDPYTKLGTGPLTETEKEELRAHGREFSRVARKYFKEKEAAEEKQRFLTEGEVGKMKKEARQFSKEARENLAKKKKKK